MTGSAPPRFPEGAVSRAVLIGCGHYDDIDLPAIPAVRSNLADLCSALTDSTHGILPPEHCQVLADPVDQRSVGMALAQAAREAEDLLLVYYTGHGLLDDDGLLHFALSCTDPGHVGFTGVSADLVKRYLGRARARLRILVLDCCFSGRAVAAMAESDSLPTAQIEVSGTYTLTSTTSTSPSHAPPGQRHTAFTAALLDALNQPQPLTLDGVHQHIESLLRGAGLPLPQRRSVNAAGNLALVRGPVPLGGSPPMVGPKEIRFHRPSSQPSSPPGRRRSDIVKGLMLFAAAITVLVLIGLASARQLFILLALPVLFVGLVLLLVYLQRGVYYDLVVNRDGVGIENHKRSALVPWKDLECLGVVHRAPGTLIWTHVLLVRLKADAPRPPGFDKGTNKNLPDQRYVVVGALSTYDADPMRLRSAIEHFAGGIYRTDQQLLEIDPRLR